MKIKNQEGFFEQPNKGNSQSKHNSVKENQLFVCIGYGSEQLIKKCNIGQDCVMEFRGVEFRG